jgi:hypothetical protein
MFCLLGIARGQTPQPQPPVTGFRIAGVIVNAVGGGPLTRARVTIFDVNDPQNPRWMITSDDGRFEFKQLRAGKYNLGGAKRGFIAADYEQHEQSTASDSAESRLFFSFRLARGPR